MLKIIKNTSIYTLGNFIPKAIGILLLPIYTYYLSPSEYGIIGSMQAMVSILMVLFTLGFDASVFRLYWDYTTETDRKELFGTMVIAKTIITSVILLIILLFHNTVNNIFPSIPFFPYYFYIVIAVFLSSYFELPKKYFMLKEKPTSYIIFNISAFIVKSGLIIWFIVSIDNTAKSYLQAFLLSTIVIFPAAIVITSRFINFKLSISKLKNILSFSLPIMPTLIFAWIMDLSDRIFLERYYSVKEIGIYSLAYQISSIIIVLIVSFHNTYRPIFFKLANNQNKLKSYNLISKYNNIFIIGIAFVIFIVSIFSNEIINIFFNNSYSMASKIIPLILIAHFFNGLQGLIGRYLEQSKKMVISMWIALIASVLNIILNFILIPPFGMQGAAIATIVSFFTSFILRYFYAKKHTFFVSFNWMIIIPFLIILFLLGIILQNTFGLNIYIIALLKVFLVSLMSILLIIKFYPEIKSFLNKSE